MKYGAMGAILLLPILTFAATVPVPTIEGGGGWSMATLVDILKSVSRFLIIVSVIIAVIMIIVGGIMWMLARDNEDMAGKARKTVVNGIIGAAIVLAVGVILQTIQLVISRGFFNAQ